ncbi:MAG: hypothetical protein A2X49_12345 [Lentisphaerae bacterium GWF2_52_8]|nr:MAG: hypothetical protein A2X49_12345 [Lentisphaerae bacterium GWF2_52_8]
MIEAIVIAGRILTGPLVNLCQKKFAGEKNEPFFIVWNTHLLMTLIAVPLLLCCGGISASRGFCFVIALAALLDFTGNALTVYSLKMTALSIFGPINAYKPLFALVFGFLLLDERPGLWGVLGMLLILGGTWLLNAPEEEDGETIRTSGRISGFFLSKGVWLRFAAQLIFALGAIYLKKAVMIGGPLLSFAGWALLPLPVAALCCAVAHKNLWGKGLLKKTGAAICHEPFRWASLALLNSAMQILTLWAFSMIFVGYALACFQLSALLHVYLGHRFFGEKNLRARLGGALIMGLGAVLILLGS